MKIKKHIEIVRSTTSELSSMSEVSCKSLYDLLCKHFVTVGVTTVNNQSDLDVIVQKQPDLVFLGMKYVPSTKSGEKTWVSEFLDSQGILHTGSGQKAVEYEQYKPLAKQRVTSAGVPTASSMVIKQEEVFNDNNVSLKFPLFVKPVGMGGGAGINEASHVHTMEQLRSQVTYITKNLASDVLVEEYLPGREFSVALLKNLDSDVLEVMPIELIAPSGADGEPILSQEIKTSNQERVLAVPNTRLRTHIVDTATAAFYALGARDYGRIDIRLDGLGVAHFLEANLIPSLISGYGSFPKACVLNLSMEYPEMILRIVNLAFNREVSSDTEALEPVNSTYDAAVAYS